MNEIIKGLTSLMMLAAAAVAPVTSPAADGVEVNHLGVNNTLVRVTAGSRYLLLPVQESNDDARIEVLVDGKPESTIFVRLAKSKVDYSVPFDLAPYKGHDVLLNIITTQNRSNIREAKDDACWKNLELADSFDTVNREYYRPVYHHTPLYGWMNDPNGMFYKDGVWHLYYQWNPYGSKWQNMTWGHSSSKDFVNWEHHPAAIEPNGLGAVFSGSSVVDTENTAGFGKNAVVSLYTSAGASQIQSLAHSNDDGRTFEIYPGNPVITLESEARDPNMFWDDTNKQWVLSLAHALDHEMLFFTSPDLKNWTRQSAFGKGLGAQDGVWECPDLFKLKVDGTGEEKWVLVCNINPGGPFGGSATQYFVGDFDGKTFKADTDPRGNIPTKWMDFGKDHYATVSWSGAPDGRRVLLGWMSNWQYAAEVPTMQYRSANTLPRDAALFRHSDGQIYISSAPSPELLALRNKEFVNASNRSIGRKAREFSLPALNGGACEILLDFDCRKAESVDIKIANSVGEFVTLTYNPAVHTLSFDRRKSGIVDFSQDFPAVTVAPTFESDRNVSLRIFIDRSSMEVFGNDGKFVMTNLVFPTKPYSTLSISASGGNAKLENLKIYPIKE
ncbi:MAG: GH32 C-terminal domain-containing protein [Muribaculaceae bacterium]|nr:GH32 C-terminal domain-containing protein [Muribaculaceae bacterium]